MVPDCGNDADNGKYKGIVAVGMIQLLCLGLDRFLSQYGFLGSEGIFMELRAQIVTKYFMLNEASRSQIELTDIWQLVNNGTPEAVVKCWGTLFTLVSKFQTWC
jgi:hypothetical protein